MCFRRGIAVPNATAPCSGFDTISTSPPSDRLPVEGRGPDGVGCPLELIGRTNS